jgi:lysophospholipase L1-like esterase
MSLSRRRLLSVPPLAAGAMFLPRTQAPAPVRIMGLGDSITDGYGGSVPGASYRTKLTEHFTRAAGGFRFEWVGSVTGANGWRHEGHPSWRIEELTAAVTPWLAEYRPDVVLLHAGTNQTYGQSVSGQIAALADLIGKVRAGAPQAYIVVARIVDLGEDGDAYNDAERARNDQYAAGIPAVVKAAGPNVVDAYMRGVRGPLLADYRHPNDAGYAEMARQWYSTLAWTWAPAKSWTRPEVLFSGCAS